MKEDDRRIDLPKDMVMDLLSSFEGVMKYEEWPNDTLYLEEMLGKEMDNLPGYKVPYCIRDYVNEFLETAYFKKGKKPDLPKYKVMELLAELEGGLKFEDKIEDEVYLVRGVRSAIDKFPEYKEPYNSNHYIHDFVESLYLEKGAVEPLVRNSLGGFAAKVRASAKKHGKEKDILTYIRKGLATALRGHLDLRYTAGLEYKGEVFDLPFTRNDPDGDKPYRVRCEENRLLLVDAYQEASEICERSGAIEQMEEYRSLSQRLSKDDLRESLRKQRGQKWMKRCFGLFCETHGKAVP